MPTTILFFSKFFFKVFFIGIDIREDKLADIIRLALHGGEFFQDSRIADFGKSQRNRYRVLLMPTVDGFFLSLGGGVADLNIAVAAFSAVCNVFFFKHFLSPFSIFCVCE